MLPDHEVDIRIRYYETDAQGFVHHANYFKYFELARVEQLLAASCARAMFAQLSESIAPNLSVTPIDLEFVRFYNPQARWVKNHQQ